MTQSAAQQPQEPEQPESLGDVTHDEAGISQWEFIHTAPTRPQVLALLEGLPDVYGVKYADFADFVQALPQRKKIKKRDSRGREHEIYFDTWALYMSVSGRVAMVQRIEAVNDWVGDFIPEKKTPTGIPGLLVHSKDDGRIVYREYLQFSTEGAPLGKKPGMAWVPYSGGQQAAGSNPYEKVETAARGRAIAAWGIGVLPGSGIASVEEVETAFANKLAIDGEAGPAGRQQRQPQQQGRPTRAQLMEAVMTAGEAYRAEAGMSQDEIERKVGEYLSGRLGIAEAYQQTAAGTPVLDFGPVKDGQLQLLANDLTAGLRKLQADGPLG